MMQWIGRMLGIEDLQSIQDVDLGFSAWWAEGRPVLVLFACAAAAAAGALFYLYMQKTARPTGRTVLAVFRAALLALLVAILAEPIIALTLSQKPKPLLVLLFDGTDSMNLKDRPTGEDADLLVKAVGAGNEVPGSGGPGLGGPQGLDLDEATRLDLVKAVLTSGQGKVLDELSETYRVRAYLMDRLDQVRELELAEPMRESSEPSGSSGGGGGGAGGAAAATGDGPGEAGDSGGGFTTIDPAHLAGQLKAEGKVTAIGSALDALNRHSGPLLAGVVVISDFNQNSGQPAFTPAKKLGAPLYTVGVGPRQVVDLIADLQSPPVLKKDEVTNITVRLAQSGLTGQSARVQLLARRVGDETATFTPVSGVRTVMLDQERMEFPIPFQPGITGRYTLQVAVDPFEGEVILENNSAQREVTITDQSMKLLFVEYEPTWEWRFVKEVFHRDPLVGREGFRTFLRSADFKVRRSNELFVETLVRPRSEFFSQDVIFLSDVPTEMLSDRFQDMLVEYVEKFGGGLVVVAGPRFGPAALASTKIGDMLPVVVDPASRPRVGEFRMRFTPESQEFKFVNLSTKGDEQENRAAWNNMGSIPWYSPVVRKHPLATVLAEHPTDRCVDNTTPQPIIAVRRYGKGEVIYLGFNEFWRLRRLYGEKYYRQFWGQLIYRLALGRARGSQKRFQVYTDRQSYQAGDKVRITVEGYNEDFEPLEADKLTARLIAEDGQGIGQPSATELTIPMSRDNVVYESAVPVYSAGPHRLLVRDPETDEDVAVQFKVAPVTVERQKAERDVKLQQDLANATGGKAYELYELANLPADLKKPSVEVTTERRFELWSTWLVLGLVLALMLGEWFVRKLFNMK